MRHVEAAEVEEPGDRVRLRQHHGVSPSSAGCDILDLLGRRAPGECVGWVDERALGRAGWSSHTASIGLVVDGNEPAPARLAGRAEAPRLVGGDEPGVEAQPVALLQVLAIHAAGGSSIRWKGSKIFSSTCWRTWIT